MPASIEGFARIWVSLRIELLEMNPEFLSEVVTH